jgi:hypothetical protein
LGNIIVGSRNGIVIFTGEGLNIRNVLSALSSVKLRKMCEKDLFFELSFSLANAFIEKGINF